MASMDRLSVAHVKTSLVYLVLGTGTGGAVSLWPNTPELIRLRPVHVHMMLLGFVLPVIFGLAYHVLPRFVGRPLHSIALGWWTYGLVQAGAAGMPAGFLLLAFGNPALGAWVLPLAGACGIAGCWLFAYNAWRTLPRFSEAPPPTPLRFPPPAPAVPKRIATIPAPDLHPERPL